METIEPLATKLMKITKLSNPDIHSHKTLDEQNCSNLLRRNLSHHIYEYLSASLLRLYLRLYKGGNRK